MNRAVLACAVVIGVLAVGAGSAHAATANWNPGGSIVESGSLELRLNGGSPKTCTFNVSGTASGPLAMSALPVWAPCGPGSAIQISFFQGGVLSGGQYYVQLIRSNSPTAGPWGSGWSQLGYVMVPFTNGSAGTSSKLTFSNTVLGSNASPSGTITATGTLNVTTGSGGLMTLL
jgi:hypothetical protein